MVQKLDEQPVLIGLLIFLLLLILPGIRFYMAMANSDKKARQSIIDEFDHPSLRDDGRKLIELASGRGYGKSFEPGELPDSILETNPVAVQYDQGFLYIQYGRPFFGLIICAPGDFSPVGRPIIDGVYYYEADK